MVSFRVNEKICKRLTVRFPLSLSLSLSLSPRLSLSLSLLLLCLPSVPRGRYGGDREDELPANRQTTGVDDKERSRVERVQ